MVDTVKVAVVQAGSVAFDLAATVDKLEDLAQECANHGAKLAVFPEAFISAYPKWLDFGCRVGMRRPEGRQDYHRYWNSAIEVPGPITQGLADIAQSHGIHLVVGVIEREGKTL